MLPALVLSLWLAAPQAIEQPRQAFMALVVNQEAADDVLVALVADQIWLPIEALEGAGLRGFAGSRRNLFGRPHVSLSSLAPDLTYYLDQSEVILHITAAARFFALNRFTLQRERPAGISYARNASVHLNYGATWDQSAGTTGYGEAGLAVFGNTSLLSGFAVDNRGGIVRGISTLTIDRPSSRLRWQLGDVVPQATALGSAPIVGGFSFGREQSLDPYYFRYPTPSVRGTATTPSDVEIFVNGALVRRLQVGPGPFRFDRLPVNVGAGNVRVVIRDRLGRQQSIESDTYLASELLSAGAMDFQYVAGKVRDDSDQRPAYGEFVGTATHRIGITNWLTMGVSGEGSATLISGGPSLALRLFHFGELQLQGSISQIRDQQQGYAAYGTYNFTARWLNLNVVAQYKDDQHATLFQPPGTDQTPEFLQASAGVPLYRLGSISYSWEAKRSPAGNFGFTVDDLYDETLVRSQAQTIRVNIRLLRWAQLSSAASRVVVRGRPTWTGSASLDLVLGRNDAVRVTHYQENHAQSTFVDLNRSLPVGTGIGYRLRGSDTGGGEAEGLVELNTRFNYAVVSTTTDARTRLTSTKATLAGSVVATRGGVFFTRPLDLSSAVVDVSGLENVRILADNTLIGRTGRSGRLFIPQLLPYLANRITVVEEDIPFDHTVPLTSQLVAPPYKGAAHIVFRTTKIQARAGRIRMRIDGVAQVPAYGRITAFANGATIESPLNADGEFFLDLPDGRYQAEVTFQGVSCTVSIDARSTRNLVQDLGQLTCTP